VLNLALSTKSIMLTVFIFGFHVYFSLARVSRGHLFDAEIYGECQHLVLIFKNNLLIVRKSKLLTSLFTDETTRQYWNLFKMDSHLLVPKALKFLNCRLFFPSSFDFDYKQSLSRCFILPRGSILPFLLNVIHSSCQREILDAKKY